MPMSILKTLAVITTSIQMVLIAMSAVIPFEIPGVPTTQILVTRALVLGLVFFGSSSIVSIAWTRTWRDAASVVSGLLAPAIFVLVTVLATVFSLRLLEYTPRDVFESFVGSLAFAATIGAYTTTISLMRSKLTGRIGISKADWGISPVRPFVFWFFMLTMAINVSADLLLARNMFQLAFTLQVSAIVTAWTIAYHGDRRFEKLMA